VKFRISPRVWSFLSGSQAWIDARRGGPSNEHPEDLALMQKVMSGRVYKDGSLRPDLTPREAADLIGYIEGMEIGASDNAWDPDGLADLNTSRALLRHLNAYVNEDIAAKYRAERLVGDAADLEIVQPPNTVNREGS
jgi:hypothetical protein